LRDRVDDDPVGVDLLHPIDDGPDDRLPLDVARREHVVGHLLGERLGPGAQVEELDRVDVDTGSGPPRIQLRFRRADGETEPPGGSDDERSATERTEANADD
jgi:hypothetical protein